MDGRTRRIITRSLAKSGFGLTEGQMFTPSKAPNNLKILSFSGFLVLFSSQNKRFEVIKGRCSSELTNYTFL